MPLARNMSRPRAVASLALPAAGLLFLLSTGSAPAPRLVSPLFAVWGFRAGTSFNQPHGIAFDTARGEIVIADTGAGTIDIFTVGGRPLERFQIQSRKPDGVLVPGIPRCVAVARDGRYLVVDNTADGVALVDRRGHPTGRLNLPASVRGPASAICVLPSGEVLVGGPPKDDRIYRFDAKGALVSSWGQRGSSPGHLDGITAIAALPNRDLVVACANTQLSVQIFGPDGAYRRGFGIHDIGPGNFALPSGIAVTPDGRIWVTDEIRMSLQVFDSQGVYLGVSGGMGTALGSFLYPSALAGDGGHRLAVTDREAGRFQILHVNEGGESSEPKSAADSSARDRNESPRAALAFIQKGETP
jgi:DNA-binding beta-propeller fold protein YncE